MKIAIACIVGINATLGLLLVVMYHQI